MSKRLLLDERVCPICDKIFYPTSAHVYYDKSSCYRNKQERRLVCSYSCMRYTENNSRKSTYRKASGY